MPPTAAVVTKLGAFRPSGKAAAAGKVTHSFVWDKPSFPGTILAGQYESFKGTSGGMTVNVFFKANVEENELQKVHNLLDDVIEGRSLGDLREMFARRLQSDPGHATRI